MTLRIGTRGSPLALAQTEWVAERLRAAGTTDVEVVRIASEGDRSSAPLSEIGGQGVFTGALRQALRDGGIDVAVHSLKDLPTTPADGLELTVPIRAEARDALCVRDGVVAPATGRARTSALAALPPGSRVGTGAPRRRAQLGSHRPDLEVVDIRGNVDTRIARLTTDDPDRALDAVVLAAVGLERIDRLDVVTDLLDLADWPTAPGQAALGIETRAGERAAVQRLEHRPTRPAVDAERGVLAALGAGCTSPIGAQAQIEDGLLFLTARVYASDGSTWVTASHALHPEDAGDPAHEIAARVAEELVSQGAMELA